MENFNDILKNLTEMQHVEPSQQLRKRLALVQSHLPAHKSRQLYGGFLLSAAFAVVILFVLTSSGVAAAARGSHPGSPLFPIKKVFVHAQIQLTSDPKKKEALKKEIEEPTGTSDASQESQKDSTKKSDDQNQGKNSLITPTKGDGTSGDTSPSHTSGSTSSGSNTSGSSSSGSNTSGSNTSGGSGSTSGGSGSSNGITPTPTVSGGSNGSGSTPGGSGNVTPTPTSTQPPTPTPTKKPEDDK